MMGVNLFMLGGSPFTVNIQWMMMLAIPFMLAYNRQRGPRWKWSFYVFYPAHIVMLKLIGMALSSFAA